MSPTVHACFNFTLENEEKDEDDRIGYMIPDDLDSLNRWYLVYSAHAVAKPTSLSLLVEI
jgi:hypothetical protein